MSQSEIGPSAVRQRQVRVWKCVRLSRQRRTNIEQDRSINGSGSAATAVAAGSTGYGMKPAAYRLAPRHSARRLDRPSLLPAAHDRTFRLDAHRAAALSISLRCERDRERDIYIEREHVRPQRHGSCAAGCRSVVGLRYAGYWPAIQAVVTTWAAE